MSNYLVTGSRNNTPHVTSMDDASFNAGIIGNGVYILPCGEKLRATMINPNKCRIYDGDIVTQGRHSRIEKDAYVDLTITNGGAGQKRNDLVVVRYTNNVETGIESTEFVVIQGTPAADPTDPTYNEGNIFDGDLIVDFPIYRIRLDGITVSSPELLVPITTTLADVTGKDWATKEYVQENKPIAGKNVTIKDDVISVPIDIINYVSDLRPYWRTLNMIDKFVTAFATEDYHSSEVKPVIEEVEENGTSRTNVLYAPLPYPMKAAFVSGVTDRRYDVRSLNHEGAGAIVGETYRLYSQGGDELGDSFPVYIRLLLTGTIAEAPAEPAFEADTSGLADGAREIAQSYVDAKYTSSGSSEEKPFPFVYGANWTYASSADKQFLIGESTRVSGLKGGRMECDTFVDMILRGISYEYSPYKENASAIDADPFEAVMLPFEDMEQYDNNAKSTDASEKNKPWVSWLLERMLNCPFMIGNRNGAVRFAQDLAWLFWDIADGEKCCIFSDPQYAANGDIAFYKTDGRENFDNISHVAFIGANSDDDDTLYVYEVSNETVAHQNAVYKRPLEGHVRTPAYFVRLKFAALHD